MTIKDFILECENYSHSREHYELMKEACEHNLLCEYIDYNQYNDLMSNNELSLLVEDAQQKKEGIIDKIVGFFKHIFDMFIRFLSKFIPALRKQEEHVVEVVEEIKDDNKDDKKETNKEYKIINIKTKKSTEEKSAAIKEAEKKREDSIRKIKNSIFDDSSLDKYFPYIKVIDKHPFPYDKLSNREKTIVEIIFGKEFKIKRMKDDEGNYLLMTPKILIKNAKTLFTKTDDGFDRKGVERFLDDMRILKELDDDNNKIDFRSVEMKKLLIELRDAADSINTFKKDFEKRRNVYNKKDLSYSKFEIDLMKSVNLLNKSVSNYIQFCTAVLQFKEKHLLAVRNLYTLLKVDNVKKSFDEVKKAQEEVSKEKLEKFNNIKDRHQAANDYIKNALNDIMKPLDPINDNSKKFKEIDGMIDELKK